MKKYLLIFLLFLLLLFAPRLLISLKSDRIIIDDFPVSGHIVDETPLKSVVATLKSNIEASNEENIDHYINTLIPSARKETEKEIHSFFEKYDLHIELISIEVIDQTSERVKLRVVQQSENHNEADYRNHEATVGMTFIKVNDQWLIAESMMENTKFNYAKE